MGLGYICPLISPLKLELLNTRGAATSNVKTEANKIFFFQIRPLESLDTGFYRCEAGNDKDIVRSNTMTLKVSFILVLLLLRVHN